MLSDVPLGVFLSGGIDSSLITSLMVKSSEQKVKSFSIGFDDALYQVTGGMKFLGDITAIFLPRIYGISAN